MSTNEVEMMKSIRLLLVEDNPADARVVERHLKDAGLAQVNCEVVQTAAAATERLQKVEYDLVLLDLGLPDATGLEALRALRAVADLTPIIVLTGSDDYKTAKANETKFSNKIITREMWCAEEGVDWEDTVEQLAREQDRFKELGVDSKPTPTQGTGQPSQDPNNPDRTADPNAPDRQQRQEQDDAAGD